MLYIVYCNNYLDNYQGIYFNERSYQFHKSHNYPLKDHYKFYKSNCIFNKLFENYPLIYYDFYKIVEKMELERLFKF